MIIERMKDEGQKEEVMRRKSKLAGKRIFKDNDLLRGEKEIR